MKNLKFIVAIVGITLATFGSTSSLYARPVRWMCKGYGVCGYSPDLDVITGDLVAI